MDLQEITNSALRSKPNDELLNIRKELEEKGNTTKIEFIDIILRDRLSNTKKENAMSDVYRNHNIDDYGWRGEDKSNTEKMNESPTNMDNVNNSGSSSVREQIKELHHNKYLNKKQWHRDD